MKGVKLSFFQEKRVIFPNKTCIFANTVYINALKNKITAEQSAENAGCKFLYNSPWNSDAISSRAEVFSGI